MPCPWAARGGERLPHTTQPRGVSVSLGASPRWAAWREGGGRHTWKGWLRLVVAQSACGAACAREGQGRDGQNKCRRNTRWGGMLTSCLVLVAAGLRCETDFLPENEKPTAVGFGSPLVPQTGFGNGGRRPRIPNPGVPRGRICHWRIHYFGGACLQQPGGLDSSQAGPAGAGRGSPTPRAPGRTCGCGPLHARSGP